MKFSAARFKRHLGLSCALFLSFQGLAQQTATDFFKISLNAFKFKDYDNVIFFSNKAIELNPNYGAAYWNRAIANDCKGEYRKSVNDYSVAISKYDNDKDLATLHKNRGMVYTSLKNYDSAVIDFTKAIEINPDYNFAFWNRGIAYDGLKKYELAIADYNKAMQYFEPGNDLAQLYIQRGKDYNNLNKKVKADSDYNKVLDIIPSPGYYTAYAKYLLGDEKGAVEQLNKYIATIASAKTKPEDIKIIYFNTASIYAIMNNEQECVKYLDLAMKNGYNDMLYIAKDKDFDAINDSAAFKGTLSKYTPK